eukprot:SAG22_NODE_1374_length_4563_cov_1.852823_7_plen_80_part_00
MKMIPHFAESKEFLNKVETNDRSGPQVDAAAAATATGDAGGAGTAGASPKGASKWLKGKGKGGPKGGGAAKGKTKGKGK